MPWSPMDIEELYEEGRKHFFCPYYQQKDRISETDIIFMPYNYLLDQSIADNFKLNLGNSILIIDEGHNAVSTAQ